MAAAPTGEGSGVDFYKGATSPYLHEHTENIKKERKPNHPPKCLFKIKGEILLERQVRILKECGINDICITVDFKRELIEQFNNVKQLGLTIVPVDDWRRPFKGIQIAMGSEKECILIMGDSYITKEPVEKLIGEQQFIGAASNPESHWLLCKIPDVHRFLGRYGSTLSHGFLGHVASGDYVGSSAQYERVSRLYDSELMALLRAFELLRGSPDIVDNGMSDIDIYEMTDEFKEEIADERHAPLSLIPSKFLVRTLVPNNACAVDIGACYGELFGEKAANVDIRSIDEIKEAYAKTHNTELVVPNFIQADAANLPFENDVFDYAVLNEILEHVDDPVRVLNEAKRVASVVVICVPNEYDWAKNRNPFSSQSGHKRFYNDQMLADLFKEANFKVLEFMKLTYLGQSYFIICGLDAKAVFVTTRKSHKKGNIY